MEKFKLRFVNEPEFIIHGPAVVCKIRFTIDIPELGWGEVAKIESKFPLLEFDSNKAYGQISSKTVCLSCDEYDVTIGKHIAESKCKVKAYSVCYRVINEILGMKTDQIYKAVALRDQVSSLLSSEIDHVNEISGREDSVPN